MKELTIPVLYRPTAQKVYDYVKDCPGCTSRDIAADLDLQPQTARMALKRLQNRRLLRTEGRDPENGLTFWFLGDPGAKQEKSAATKQETVTVWPKVNVPQQTPFSALFF